jgi:lauroyl/myristoyl acyltransferase
LPLELIPSVVLSIKYAGSQQRFKKWVDLALANIAAIYSDWPADRVRKIQTDHRRYLLRTKLDPEHLMRRDPREVDRWIGAHIHCGGLEHLRNVTSSARGAVVGMPHLNRFTLAPLVLLKHGFRVCIMAAPSVATGAQKRIAWYETFTRLPGYGSFEMLPNFNLRSVSRALQLLREGYIVISYPDAPPSAQEDEGVQARMRFFGMEYSALAPTTVRVRLRNHSVTGGAWFFWLAAYSGAAFVRAAMVPHDGDSQLTFEPARRFSGAESLRERQDILAQDFYTFWEEHVVQYPDQWYGWNALQNWNPCVAENDMSPEPARTLTAGC